MSNWQGSNFAEIFEQKKLGSIKQVPRLGGNDYKTFVYSLHSDDKIYAPHITLKIKQKYFQIQWD
jgi:hypothetical protein